MKIFWSWQSDTPGKTGRHFVRKTLEEAVEKLRQPKEDIDEPPANARADELHIDAGREKVKGSPNLADTILEKIANSACLVADVTPVGYGPARKNEQGKDIPPKALMNPNVAIEVGWGMRNIPENGFLMVLNTAYGDRGSIPFDLAHKGGPLMYCLPHDATAEQIKTEHKKLVAQFVEALTLFVEDAKPKPTAFQRTASTQNKATFWKTGEPLVHVADQLKRWAENKEEYLDYYFDPTESIYFRLMPQIALPAPLKRIALEDAANQRPRVLTRTLGGSRPERNGYGAIAYEATNDHDIVGFVQFMPNGEVWCCSHDLARYFRSEYLHIPVPLVTDVMEKTLLQVMTVMSEKLGLNAPFDIEIGIVGAKGARLGLGNRLVSGDIHDPEIITKTAIPKNDKTSIQAAISTFVEDLYDAAGVRVTEEDLTA
ncbi:MAG: hypothetical protein PHW76_08405 [Alphaproteobacteria bacterium]|nr:hypothetical protein [Alphaproteobacteria bacterium]